MKHIVLVLISTLMCNLAICQSILNLHSNYETIGINVILSQNDTENDAYAIIQYKKSLETSWKNGFPLSKIKNGTNMLAGSVFWCELGTNYDIKVTIIDSTTTSLNGQLLTDNITTRSPVVFPVANQTLYVSPSGSGNLYTMVFPGSLQAALQIATAGTKIILDSGNYYIGNLTIPNSGTATNPIQIIGSSNGEVVLNGSHETALSWTPYGSSGIFVTTTDAVNPNLIIADGVRLFPHQTFPDLSVNKATMSRDLFGNPIIQKNVFISGFYRNPTLMPVIGNYGDPVGISQNKLYVKFLDNSDPNTKDIKVSKQPKAIELSSNKYIMFQNISFKYYGLAPLATAVIIKNSEHIVFDNCKFEDNNTSINYADNSQYITIQNSEFKDHFINWNAWKMKATYDEGPFVSRFPNGSRILERGAITCRQDFYGKGIVIQNNTFSQYQQAGQLTPTPSTSTIIDTLRRTLEIDFYNNTIQNVTGDGFEIDGVSRNIRVFNNSFKNVHAPLSLAVAEEGPVYILRNTFSNLLNDTIFYSNTFLQTSGHPLKFQYSDPNSEINGSVFFFHNTVDAKNNSNGLNVYQISVPNAWKELVSKNNIFVTDDGYSLQVRTLTVPNLISDYNGYFSSNTNIARVTTNNNNYFNYPNINDVFTNHGWDEHSIQTDPLFTGLPSTPYELSNNSPMIDAGIVIEGINDLHVSGIFPDIGAFEYETVLGVNHIDEIQSDFIVYPNPFNSHINIYQKVNLISYSLKMIDNSGKVVYSNEVDKNTTLNMSNITPGIYFLIIQAKDGQEVKKIIKSR